MLLTRRKSSLIRADARVSAPFLPAVARNAFSQPVADEVFQNVEGHRNDTEGAVPEEELAAYRVEHSLAISTIIGFVGIAIMMR